MIKIKCDMNKILAIHSRYIEEYVAPKFFSVYSQTSNQIKQYLLNFLGDNETEILKHLEQLCTDKELKNLILKEERIRKATYYYSENLQGELLIRDKIKKFWDTVLDYKHFGRGVKSGKYSITWNRHMFVEMTNVKVCPYCNRNYVTSYLENDNTQEITTTASIDHYYSKAKYPFLQINIYNMIPSCTICNSYVKGMKELEHLNPYVDEGSIRFETDLNSIKTLYSKDDRKKHLRIISDRDKKSMKSIEAFKLGKIYETHNDVADEVKQKAMDYENFKEDYYKKLLGNIDIGIDNIHKNWFDFLGKEEGDEPLIKLKKDIYRQIRGGINDDLSIDGSNNIL